MEITPPISLAIAIGMAALRYRVPNVWPPVATTAAGACFAFAVLDAAHFDGFVKFSLALNVGLALGLIDGLTLIRKNKAAGPARPAAPLPHGEPVDEKERAIEALRKARDNVAVALHQGNYHSHRRAFHEAEAAMLSIKRHFGIEPMKIPDETAAEAPYKLLLDAYISFIDRFYPLLRDGHVEEARERRNAFKCSWGQA